MVVTLERLLSISRRLSSTLEMRPLLQQIVESAEALTDADDASILLMEDGGALRFAATTGPQSSALETARVPLDSSLAGWVVMHRDIAIVRDARSDARLASIEAMDATQSIMAVPMVFGNSVIGVLEAVTTTARHQFTQQDRETMETLASMAAVAVQNARLFQQSDWVAEVVHEIRTPLTAILSYTDLLRRPDLDDELRVQAVETIQRETQRVSALATEFLELARLESGRASLARDTIDVADLVCEAVSVIRPKAEDEEREVRVILGDALPQTTGDRERLHQVLLNLLSNAVKYTDPGDIITIKAISEDDSFLISIADTGPGIPQSQIPMLFQKFQRLPSSTERAPGTGLGLVVARQIVEAHQGRIWVESEIDQGSCFFVWLPVLAPDTGA
ncbi:MAG: GAF domain-containing sensor histidine kinase [Anaerolineae bacterium]|nr:GAF domain-containing sensor histidine kinase [Anaerolineae bacterium]